MATLTGSLRRRRHRRVAASPLPVAPTASEQVAPVDIAPNDPLLAYLQSAHGPVDLETLDLDSSALSELRAVGVKLSVPLISQGELIGVLNVGPRRSEQDYSIDDRRLLDSLATQAAPALRVGQLVRQQEAEARTRQRFEQELEVARLIQKNFLPHDLPQLEGWDVAAYYQPAREVGGDFYDVIPLPGGHVGFVIGDVTDKGVPAALVMAATRSVLRAFAQQSAAPGTVLERVNEHLHPDMPEKMFVTCFYGVLDPRSGVLRFANAGHDVPYLKTAGGCVELRARGMPLGLMPGMAYEEKEVVFEAGDSLLLHSDGIVEAHDPARQMFGFETLKAAVARHPGGTEAIARVLADVRQHTGPDAEQEDDITMVTVQRWPDGPGRERIVLDLDVESREGNERGVAAQVAAEVSGLGLSEARLDRLRTAVAEATMNAMEHGNSYRADLPVRVQVSVGPEQVRVRISDHGQPGPEPVEQPDLEAKLAGLQRPRGWGLFLIKAMVDDLEETTSDGRHTVQLTMRRGEQ
ncbi:MAG TPA: SpoIIE family protein phosphatase [Nocardioidaceae bacterium]|nr:SpoIIE family protein phosphatase [Nocardioidaceae bacterium]